VNAAAVLHFRAKGTSMHPPTTPADQPAGLHPVVKATGFVSFFTDMGSEILYPIMPAFLTMLGASRATIGAIEGIAEGLPAVIKLFSGTLADRVRNRKWLVLSGYALSTLSKPLVAFARGAGFVLVVRIVDRIGKGIRTAPRDALVADFTDKTRLGYAFGYQRGMDHAGALVGGLLGFALLGWLGSDLPGMRRAILWAFIPGVLSVLIVLFFVRDRPNRVPRPAPARRAFAGLRDLPRDYFIYVAIASVFAIANSSDAFLLLRAQDVGVGIVFLPLLWSLLHLVKTGTAIWGGWLSDRIGRRPVLVAGWIVYAAVYVGFALVKPAWGAWALFVVYGLFYGLTEGAGRAVIADLVPAGQRGTAFGFWGMLEGGLLIAASLLTGWLWDRTGGGAVPLLVCGAAALAAAASLALWGLRGGLRREGRRMTP
jgi:MFS family permease